MTKFSWSNDFKLQISCQLHLPSEAGEKLELLSDFSLLYQRFEQFATWFDNPEVPDKQKEPYNMHMVNAKVGLSFVYKFLQACGCSDLEIQQYTKLPF